MYARQYAPLHYYPFISSRAATEFLVEAAGALVGQVVNRLSTCGGLLIRPPPLDPPLPPSQNRPQRLRLSAMRGSLGKLRPAMALQFQEMIDRGGIQRHADLARLGCVSRERISQMMVLTWLAPDIQEAILRLPQVPGGRLPVSEGALRKMARMPLWEDQRTQWPSASADARALN